MFLRIAACAIAVLSSLAIGSCRPGADGTGLHFGATIQPLAMILSEIAGERAKIVALLPPGASPHTYEPRPSEIRAAQSAEALFYVSPLLDGWAARMPAKKKIQVFEMVPMSLRLQPIDPHSHGEGLDDRMEPDPHFWTDPLTVKAIVPRLADALIGLDPSGREHYRAKADEFTQLLDRFNEKLTNDLVPLRGRSVVLFHPSFQYFFARYGIMVAGVMEPFPGREPTPKELQRLIRRFRETGADAVITEPQSPKQSAAALAEALGVPLVELDPIGGVGRRVNYWDMTRHNAATLLKALK